MNNTIICTIPEGYKLVPYDYGYMSALLVMIFVIVFIIGFLVMLEKQ